MVSSRVAHRFWLENNLDHLCISSERVGLFNRGVYEVGSVGYVLGPMSWGVYEVGMYRGGSV